MASKTGKVGFVGGMDIPLIRKFACGYVQGVKAAKPDAEVFQNMTGTTRRRLERSGQGRRTHQGADRRRAPTSSTPPPAAPASACCRPRPTPASSAIGVDCNQNYLHPGKVLTSMLKRVDVAVYNAFKDGKDGTLKPGIQVLGLTEDGVGYAHGRQQQGAGHRRR